MLLPPVPEEFNNLKLPSYEFDIFKDQTIFVSKISSLNHKVLDDTMEDGAFVAFTYRFLGQLNKIFDSLWHCFAK